MHPFKSLLDFLNFFKGFSLFESFRRYLGGSGGPKEGVRPDFRPWLLIYKILHEKIPPYTLSKCEHIKGYTQLPGLL